MSDLLARLEADLVVARKAQDKPRTLLLSTTLADIKNRRIELQRQPTDDDVVEVLRKETARGRTLILAIHQLGDAERVCDRFLLLAGGRVRGMGTLGELRMQTGLPQGSLEDIFLALT